MESALRRHLPNGTFGRVTPACSRLMGAVSSKNNKSTELRLRMALVHTGLRGWILHAKHLPGRPDFFFNSNRLAIFVDGCFWHGCPACGHFPKVHAAFWRAKIERNRERDEHANRELESNGFRVMRFWEHELRTDLKECVRRVSNMLRGTIVRPKGHKSTQITGWG
jgi:DNA mismatch endonuclease Vsr